MTEFVQLQEQHAALSEMLDSARETLKAAAAVGMDKDPTFQRIRQTIAVGEKQLKQVEELKGRWLA